MDIDTIAKIEHFSTLVDLNLKEFCDKFRLVLELPALTFNSEDETEWAEVNFEGINYNISKPYKVGLLNKWDDQVPEEHNFEITLTINKTNTNFNKAELEKMGNLLSNHFNAYLLHYRTWFSSGFNTEKVQIFTPIKNN